ncbi:MAG: FKBP-type peptidyl-prolyl cis-trans isomerase [Porphyromonas sp.]|nr:FKBP-type peptidyl-prolyl cis-trans isomerase [Porphyromonas sp.]
MDKISYALGLSIGHNFTATGIKGLNTEEFLKGMDVALKGAPSTISIEEAQKLLNEYFQKLQEDKYTLNKEAGEEFLRINKEKAGVVTLPSGAQYQILTKGEGEQPKATDKVKCHYHGTLINGTVFDSSYQRGEPATFPLNGVIKGWTEVVQLMPVGSKWRVFLPYQLAYGEQGAGQSIEPYSTLIFDIELLSIEK